MSSHALRVKGRPSPTVGESTLPASGGAGDGSGTANATVGDTLTLSDGQGLSLAITLTKTERVPALVGNGNNGWEAGDLVHPALLGVQLLINNVGDVQYDGSPSGVVAAVDTQDQQHQAEILVPDITGNPRDGSLINVNISPGDKRLGWVYFAAGKKAQFRTFQYLVNGSAPEVGEWSLE